jgi:S-DNA-T family DNA segregation ATPase FtsK/SpoIIIE
MFFVNEGFGISFLFALYFFVVLGIRLVGKKLQSLWKAFFYAAFGMIWFSLFFGFIFNFIFHLFPDFETNVFFGGAHGKYMTEMLEDKIAVLGTLLLLTVSMFVFCLIAFKDKTIAMTKKAFERFKSLFKHKQKKTISVKPEKEEDKPEEEEAETTWIIKNNDEEETKIADDDFEIVVPEEEDIVVEPEEREPEDKPDFPTFKEETYDVLAELGEYDPTLDLSHYRYPSVDLLREYTAAETQVNMEEQTANKNKILSTLDSFGIKIATIKATVGPTITLYEIQPEAGVRISKIKNLEDDIALSLAALGIRIIAPIPGKGTIGIEVPNRDPQTVSMRSVISSKKFQEAKFDLPIALGKTITNDTFVFDLCKMPHLLVAGATGQGKSVGLNAIITSLLYKKHPSQVKFVLVDPKKVEFNIYADIERHFLAKLPDEEEPVITDVSKVVQTLNSLTKEMDERYNLLKKAHSRNIKEYNEKFIKRRLNPEKGHRFMPYIVVIIDEFGDLIMTAGKEVELPIARIAQLARAVGIHMIIATQRPSVSIITGVIKANFPARIAFRVSAMVDSRTILDASGANQLVGKGDLLFSQGSDLVRVQCAFVDTPEVEKIAAYIGDQQGYPTAHLLPEYTPEGADGEGGSFDASKLDSMFEQSARFIVAHQQGSTSALQRTFEIGYNRAGRIMDQMEKMGVVSPAKGSKPRDVLVQTDMQLDMLLAGLK